MTSHAAIIGVSGYELTKAETSFLCDFPVWGVILFARNVRNHAQISELGQALRAVCNDPHLPILIDQEGGRVARLRPPLMRVYPPAQIYGDLYRKNKADGLKAAYLGALLLAYDLRELGINVNCAPCLDIAYPTQSDIIGNRAFSDDPEAIATLGQTFINGLYAGGVLPVIKHLPGHGRAKCDSHVMLPHIDAAYDILLESDFQAFRALIKAFPAQSLMGMTGHLLYTAIDAARASTHSPVIIQKIIRELIGFDGLLMSDDIAMQALSGDIAARARHALAAGCDLVLHCTGDMDDMRALQKNIPILGGAAAQRADKIKAQLINIKPMLSPEDRQKHEKQWAELMTNIFPYAQNTL